MRLLLIAIASVILFFPLYWALHPFFGANWGAGIAAFMMYIGFPSLFLLKWGKRSRNPMIKKINSAFAVIILGLVGWVLYQMFFKGAPVPNSIALVFVYSYLAFYFLKHGYMPYQAREVEKELQEYENT
jgi:membrane protease YdiL (CAAX protease family)